MRTKTLLFLLLSFCSSFIFARENLLTTGVVECVDGLSDDLYTLNKREAEFSGEYSASLMRNGNDYLMLIKRTFTEMTFRYESGPESENQEIGFVELFYDYTGMYGERGNLVIELTKSGADGGTSILTDCEVTE